MQRETLLAVLPGPDPLSNEQKLLACDDGTGKDAPVTGAVSEVRRFHPGQSVIEGTLRVIVLAYPAPPNTLSSIIFAVNSALGEDALLSKSGKGLIRVDRDNGIAVYPPSYELRRVFEDRIYTVVDPRKTAAAPCTITYLAENPSAPPQKVLHSHLDCTTLIQQTSSDAIFGGNVPQ
jgi:hypothetical protein